MNAATFGDEKYFVPTMMAGTAVWYQTALFSTAGLTIPETLEDLEMTASQLKTLGVAPFMLANKEKWASQFYWTQILVARHGVEAYNDLLSGKASWTDSPYVDAWQTLQSWSMAGYFYGSPNSISYAESTIPWAAGEVAMTVQGTWYQTTLASFDGEEATQVQYFDFPAAHGKSAFLEFWPENTLMINARSDKEHRDGAAAFIDYYVSVDAQLNLARDGRLFPSSTSVDLAEAGASAIMLEFAAFANSYVGAPFMHVDLAFTGAVSAEFMDATQGVLNGTVSPHEAAERVRVANAKQ